MKNKTLSLILLVLLNLSIFFTIGFSQSVNTTVLDNNVEKPQDQSLFDVEREIQAFEDQIYPTAQSNFNPGPLNTNNLSADLSISQKDQEEQTIKQGHCYKNERKHSTEHPFFSE